VIAAIGYLLCALGTGASTTQRSSALKATGVTTSPGRRSSTRRRRAPGTALDFYRVRLDEVLATHIVQRAGTCAQYPLSFDTLTTGADSAGFLDEVTISYANPVGVLVGGSQRWAGGPREGGWDLKLNKKI